MLFFDSCPSPGGLGEQNRLLGAPRESGISPQEGRKPLEASRGRSWLGAFADFVTQPLLDASGVALGSLGVDFEELQAPNMMIWGCFFWFLPRALFAARFDCFRYLFSSRFLCFFGRARTRAKCENCHPLHAKTCFFKVRAGVGRATGKATDDQKRQQK